MGVAIAIDPLQVVYVFFGCFLGAFQWWPTCFFVPQAIYWESLMTGCLEGQVLMLFIPQSAPPPNGKLPVVSSTDFVDKNQQQISNMRALPSTYKCWCFVPTCC